MKKILFLQLIFLPFLLNAQITQTVRGKVADKQSKFPIEGATVEVISLSPVKWANTDDKGEFNISDVPVGRHDLRITILGYNEQIIPNILLTAGKEIFLNIELEEQVMEMEEVVIETTKDKSKTNNEMSVVSNRTFSIEETSRYAGSRNDPARMAMNFAGVTGTSDARNDIIIRGNTPLGVLWRLEGIDIPSPNHFGTFGTTGGPISMLNNNVLSNSDFMTGAWPSQYGNALAGVFDLQMRRGNNQKREYMIQMGFNGLELGAEGPFSKNHGASYLANYRYSTLGIFKTLGINFGTSALPEYQDLNFKLHFPTEKAGTFTIFGLGGISQVKVKGENTDTTDLYSDPGDNTIFQSHMGVLGFSNTYFINNNTYSKAVFAISATRMFVSNDSIPKDSLGNYSLTPVPDYRNEFRQVKYSLNYSINKKFSAKNTLTTGLILDYYFFNLVDSVLQGTKFITLRNFDGNSMLAQAYTTWQHRFSEKLILNSGLHIQFFAYNKKYAFEPRLGLRYKFRENQSINFGYGLHSQLQAFQAYFREDPLPDGTYIKTNKDLGFTKSHQAVLGYDYSINKNLRLRVESYYQYIFNAAVERNSSSFSMLNSGADFIIFTSDSLVNKGTGENYGFEITFEKFYSHNYYFLITASIYNSRYKGSDGVERNSAFNGNYTFNVLGGKEFRINEKNAITLDGKVIWAGGRRYTPVNLPASVAANSEVIDSLAYSEQFPDYFRCDFKVGYRLNGKKASQEFALDVQNIFNRKNAFIQKYNIERQKLIVIPQLGIFPVVQYRLTF
ncbi:MAG: carboxypeptidase-like regulatory domain-containing protein [Cytophagaceae bacterium]|nr:carboxypeptidase-like regulatory domain-containing protein [Cytophagaceae bacterium]